MDRIKQDECVIDRVIVHVLDNKQPEPQLTDEAVILPPRYESLLRAHIASCLGDSIPCLFDKRDENPVYLKCQEAFADADSHFIPTSKTLTADLFGLMRKQTINQGTLWVVLFRKREESSTYLAVLKMDDKSSLVWKQEITKDGKRILHLEGNDHTVPQQEVKLDKAAFIFPQSLLPDGKLLFEYDLRVVDRKLPGGEVAKFFTTFLGCSAAFEAKRSTKRFIDTVDRFAAERAEELKRGNLVQDLQLTKAMYLRNHDEIKVDDYAAAVFGDQSPELKGRLVEVLQQSLQANSFHVDPDEKRKRNQRTVWKIMKGNSRLELRGDDAAFQEMVDAGSLTSDGVITIRASRFTTA